MERLTERNPIHPRDPMTPDQRGHENILALWRHHAYGSEGQRLWIETVATCQGEWRGSYWPDSQLRAENIDPDASSRYILIGRIPSARLALVELSNRAEYGVKSTLGAFSVDVDHLTNIIRGSLRED